MQQKELQQKEYFGLGAIKNLNTILSDNNLKRVFLVTGRRSYELCGAKNEISKIKNAEFHRFYNFSPNPKLEEINQGFFEFNRNNYDTIVAIGGGSAIDVAKSIKSLYFDKTNEKIPLIAIPTTSGSGSEATYFIVYYKGKEKQSKGDPSVTLPDYSICDPKLTLSLPKKIAASTGMDALGQAIESYWSINSTKQSKKLSEQAIKTLLINLENSVNTGIERSRMEVMKAANLAGKAINLTKTTACHSVAYPITSYFKIPHGHAVALTLGEMLDYNSKLTDSDCLDKRGNEYVKKTLNDLTKIFFVKTIEEVRDKINSLMKSIGLETKLSELNLTEKDIDLIVEKGFAPERVKNNPRRLTEENLRRILNKIY